MFFKFDPYRDRRLVENRCSHDRKRAVRYAIFNINIMSLTGHPMRRWICFFTNILFLTEHLFKNSVNQLIS